MGRRRQREPQYEENYDDYDEYEGEYEDNPYAADEDLYESRGRRGRSRTSTDFYVDGKQIECGTSVVLPEICIRTGDTEGLIEVNKTLSYSSPLMRIFAGALIAAMTAKKCKVTYYISPETQSRNHLGIGIGAGGIALGIVLLVSSGAADMPALAGIGFVFLIAGLIALILLQVYLKPTKYKDGRFWLSGFKPDFFDALEDMYTGGGRGRR